MNNIMGKRMSLYEIQQEYDEVIDEYLEEDIGVGTSSEKVLLSDYNDRLAYLFKELRKHAKTVWGWRTARDDKACSAFKARVARKLCKTGHPEIDGGKRMSWNKALEFAGSMSEYEEFLEERQQCYEDWDSIEHLRNSIKQYMINIGGRLAGHH